MSADDYVPDERLRGLFDALDRADADIVEELCPAFSELVGSGMRYADEELIGKGGLKEVYKAFDRHTQQWVALARLRRDRDLRCYDYFVREAWLISSLNHPNIIKVYDAGADEAGRPYFTMDLKGRTSLADLIRQNHPRSELLEIFQKVCEAVAYAHAQGVIHLDLKPENIQCERFGEVLVCDWGLGRKLQGEAESFDCQPTCDGSIRGTPGYMAPEQVLAAGSEDERTDVYALGCMLHTILCGEPPFSGSTDERLEQTRRAEIAPLRTRFPARRISESMEAVVLKASARCPEDRYGSAMELKEEIHKFLSGFSTEAESTGFFKEARLFIRRNRRASSVALLALVAVTVLSVLFVQRLGRQQLVTEEERSRANRLMTEVDLLSADNESLFNQTLLSKKELATQLARSALLLRNFAFYYRPEDTVVRVDKLLKLAIQLDTKCSEARWQQFALKGLQLDFEGALAVPHLPHNKMDAEPMQLALAFPHYHFSKTQRPSAQELIDLFDYAAEHVQGSSGFLTQVFIYQEALARPGTDLSGPLEALLARYNGGRDHFSMAYDAEAQSLEIWTDRNALALRAGLGEQRACLLRFLPVRSLKIRSSGLVRVHMLSYLDLERLDLSECRELDIQEGIRLEQLKTLVVKRGAARKERLYQAIQTRQPFEIVEVD